MLVKEAISAASGDVKELAEEIGVSYWTLYAWAEDRRNPTPANKRRLAQVLRRRITRLETLVDLLEQEGMKNG